MYFARHKDLNFLNPESHKIFRKLVEDIKVGIFMADTLGKLFYVNKAFIDRMELQSSGDILGENWANLCLTNLVQREEFFSELANLGIVKDFEILSGKNTHLLITANEIYSDQGERIGIYGSVVDISDRRKLEEDLLVKNTKLEQILNFCNTLGEISQIDELTQYIVHQTAEILDTRRCSLMFLDDGSNELYVNASCGLSDGMAQKRVRIGDPVAGIIAMQNKAVLVEDIEDNDFFKGQNKEMYTQHSFMSAPFFYNQKLLGILNVSEKKGLFDSTDLKVLETIARQAAISIHKSQELSNFEYLSQTDSKTGLFNYRSFLQRIDEEIQRAKRYGSFLSLMMIDVDNFKTYNDTKGHPEGDKLLKKLAEIFKANLRTTEFICRYGGDEFAIILPQTEAVQAAVAAEKIRKRVAQEFSNDGISISIGLTQFQGDLSKEDFIKQADELLYQSKKSGRNQVSIHQLNTLS